MNPRSQSATPGSEGQFTLAFHVNRAESTRSCAGSGVSTAFGPDVPVIDAVTVNVGEPETGAVGVGETADGLVGRVEAGGAVVPRLCPAPTGPSSRRTGRASCADNASHGRDAPCPDRLATRGCSTLRD